jgi:hypothetical protein
MRQHPDRAQILMLGYTGFTGRQCAPKEGAASAGTDDYDSELKNTARFMSVLHSSALVMHCLEEHEAAAMKTMLSPGP